MDAFEKEWAEYVRKDDIGSGFTYDEVRRAALHFHRAGMRRAAEIAKQQNDEHAKNLRRGKGTWPQNDYIRDEIWHQWEGQEQASRWIANDILKEAGE